MSEDRSWALAAEYDNPDVFFEEFHRRYPFCDSIPARETYVEFVPAESICIDGVTGPYEPDSVFSDFANACEKKEEGGKEVPHYERIYKCNCGQEIKSKVGFSAHRRKCKL